MIFFVLLVLFNALNTETEQNSCMVMFKIKNCEKGKKYFF